MAIYHFSVQRISRGQGKSSVGASAYRAGKKLENERDGLTHDYTKRKDVVHNEIISPDKSPEWVQDREKLWNQVERMEKRKDANTAREINVALPKELSHEQQKELVRKFVKDNFTSKGMIADVAIHDKGNENPHAHIMLPTRAITPEGFVNKKVAELDKKEKTVELWRESWAKHTNWELERAGIQDRIDHRSFIDQGIEKLPTRHEGYIVRAMEKRAREKDGIEPEISKYNRQVIEENKKLELINRQIKTYERSLENERDRTNGNQNRDIGVERGAIGNQDPDRDYQSKIIFGRTSSNPEITNSRPNRLDGQNQDLGGKSQQVKSEVKRGMGKGYNRTEQPNREEQQNLSRVGTTDKRVDREQQPEARNDNSSSISRTSEERGETQIFDKRINESGERGQEHSQPIMEGKGEAIRNTAIDHNRLDSCNIGISPAINAFDKIIQTLKPAIEKAEQAEKEVKNLDKVIKRARAKEAPPRERKIREHDRGMER